MASFQELMRAAVNAENAGDQNAAQQLVQMAQSIGQQAPASQDVAGTGALAPRAYDPESNVETPKVDSFGPTIAAATKGPSQSTVHHAKNFMDPERSIPQRAGDAAMTALSAAGTTYAFGAGLVGEMLGGSPTQEKKLARDLMMMGEVSVPELAGVSSTVAAANRAAKSATKLSKVPTEVQRTARAADDLGITPSLGAGGKIRGQVAAGLEKVPFAGNTVAKDATRFVDEIETTFNNIVSGVGEVRGAAGAGEALQTGLNKFVKQFKDKADDLYNAVGRHIPRDTLVQAPATRQMIADALEPFADKPAIRARLGLDKWAAIADDLEGGLSWEAATQLRSDLGKAIGKIQGPLADMDQGRLKQAFGQLTSDLEAAAKAAGPEAEKAWMRANRYYKRGGQRISDALDQTINAKSPERAFEAFANMAKEGRASADINRMFKIKSSMPKEEWSEVSASIIDRLGKARPGQQNAAGDAFSASTFLTEWNKLTPEAKSILLPKNARQQLNKLAEVAEGAKRAGAERNFSNTGTTLAQTAVGAGAVMDPVVTGSALLGANVSAKAMTSTRFLSALNKYARGDTRALRNIAKGNDPLAIEARTILRMSAADAAQATGAANTDPSPLAVGR